MVQITSRLAALCTLALAACAAAVPVQNRAVGAPASRALQARDGFAGPYFAVYSDAWVSGQTSLPDPALLEGFNVFILSFLLSKSSADQAVFWEGLAEADRKAALDKYHAAGIKVIVSAFGATELPTSQGFDAVETANSMADWVLKYGLDGIDVDYEDLDAMNKQDGAAEKWLSDFTTALRAKLPQGQYILTHAPLAPWFSAAHYKTGAYTAVHKNVGDQIDWYNMQFYNQGASEYTTCDNLLTASSSQWPDTAVDQIASKGGVDRSKIVIGKPAGAGDASNGFMDAATLGGCLAQAQANGGIGGAMSWQYPHADKAWAAAVRGSAFPIGGGGAPPSAPSGTAAPSGPASAPVPSDTAAPSAPVTSAPAPSGPASAPVPSGPASAPVPSGPASAPVPSGPASAPVPSGPVTSAPAPSGPASAPVPSDTAVPSGPASAPVPSGPASAPVPSGPASAPVPSGPASAPAPSGTAGTGSGSCAGAAAWDAATAYTGGATVTFSGAGYKAKWWTQNETPGKADVWAAC